jgi:secreted PhoX family phosphatase
MSHDFDPITNDSNNEHFQDVLARALGNPSRRSMLKGSAGLAAMLALPMLPGCGGGSDTASTGVASTAAGASSIPALPADSTLKFSAVPYSIADQVTVPPGYNVQVLHATGDTLDPTKATAYTNMGTETGMSWEQRVGDHADGMELYYIDANGKSQYKPTSKAVLAVNHESSADSQFLMATGQTSGTAKGQKFSQFGGWNGGVRPGDEVLKEINLHGISVVELTLDANGKPTGYNPTSPLNRRVTAQTPAEVHGPAAHLSDLRDLMVTKFSPTGATVRGTLNNCGHGPTPWGTYMGCEENWAFYFNVRAGGKAPTDTKMLASRKRYGVAAAPFVARSTTWPALAISQGWYTPTDLDDTDFRFTRWNTEASGASAREDFRNEPNTFGYNVEIDPANPASVPAKRMAMGRFAHEAAVCSLPVVGSPLAFYMGCDSRNEYIYKFVTTANWSAADIGGGMAAGNKYLNEGKLYVAKFNDDGSGQWLELNISNPAIQNYSTFKFANQAEVLVHTRLAADAVGATKMDRPEWGAVNPANGEVYFTMTNNSAANRTPLTTNSVNPRAYADPDGIRGTGNPNGHIVRFKEAGNLSTATTFTWDIFVFGAEDDSAGDVNISKLTRANAFSSPDGLWFSNATKICWIQTDDGAFTDESNCMLLAAVPGKVGDGGQFMVANTNATSTAAQKTFVGGILGESRLRRFLVAPRGAEVTGLTETADGKTLFVNIQHPGENTAALGTSSDFTYESQWPSNGGGIPAKYGSGKRPRSATLMITKADGGMIGM